MKSLRVAVIGAGYWGPNIVRNLNEAPGADPVAVADLSDERLETIHKRFPAVRTTKDYRELFADPSIDAVCIATPVYDDVQSVEKVKIYDHGVNELSSEELRRSYRSGDIRSPHIAGTEALQMEMRHFIECINSGARPRSGARVAYRVEAARPEPARA